MNLATASVTLINGGGSRRQGWRTSLQDGGTTVWRCECGGPHRTADLATACAIGTLSRRDSGFYAGSIDMDEWMPVPRTTEAQQELIHHIESLPGTAEAAMAGLDQFYAAIMREGADGRTIGQNISAAEATRILWRHVREVRERAEVVALTGGWRIGELLVRAEGKDEATGGSFAGRDASGGFVVTSRENMPATLAEKVGNQTRGKRLKVIRKRLHLEGLHSVISQFHRRDEEATIFGIIKAIRMEDSEWRRLDSLTTPAIKSGMDYRIGDCRVVLNDIEDDSIPLILTDPPYGNVAEPLYEWLGGFAARVLIPGGSLIVYTGGGTLLRDGSILLKHLKYNWECVMLHGSAQKIFGAGVQANHKPILWFVKQFRRNDSTGRKTLVPSVVRSTANKVRHDWGQGDGGIKQWIHRLTEPGEMVVDPFAGSGEWGEITCEEGRRWIGCDLEYGGTTTIETGEYAEMEMDADDDEDDAA
jgi:hypothetical protein